MISNIFYYILGLFNTNEPEIKDLSSIEIIDSLITHYKFLGCVDPVTKFTVYNLPCSSFSNFTNVIYEFIEEIEKQTTSSFTKFNTVKFNEELYIRYFKMGNRFYTREEATRSLITILERLGKALYTVEKSELKFYYDSRAYIILEFTVLLLQALHNER